MDWNDWFVYDESSISYLRWKVDRYAGGRKLVSAGDEAGTIGGVAYYRIQLRGKLTYNHIVIWEMHNGPVPDGLEVDHEDRNGLNNKIGNLRLTTKSVNCRNRRLRSDSSTKINAVNRRERVLPSGSVHVCWIGRYVTLDRKRLYKEFSVAKYGEEEAKKAAIAFVEASRKEDNGGEYTTNHGQGE